MCKDKDGEVTERIEKVQTKSFDCISKAISFNKTWVIQNYKGNTDYKSPIFAIGNSGKIRWRLKLNASTYAVWPSLKLLPCDLFEVVCVKPTYSLLDVDGEKAITLPTQTFCGPVSESSEYRITDGKHYYFNDVEVFDDAKKLFSNGNLTLSCDIVLLITCIDEFDLLAEFAATKVPMCDLVDDFGNLLENGKFSDFTINVGDQEFHVHKNVLSVRSPVFEAMFEHQMVEKQENRTNVTNIEPHVFKEMLRYMYTGEAPNVDKMADELLMAAEKYQLERLKIMCEEALCAKITVENAADMLTLADLHNGKHLKERTIDFIIGSNLPKIVELENFRRSIESRPVFSIEILRAVAASRK